MASERIQRRIDRLLDQMEEAADERDWQSVRQLAQDVLRLDPENRDAAGDRATATTLLDDSLANSSELGMSLLTERVQSRQEILRA